MRSLNEASYLMIYTRCVARLTTQVALCSMQVVVFVVELYWDLVERLQYTGECHDLAQGYLHKYGARDITILLVDRFRLLREVVNKPSD